MIKFNVALDGPAGAGKSTVARLVAEKLGFVYVDTGAMYRAVTWKVLQLGIDPEREDDVAAAADKMRIDLLPGDGGQQVFVDDADVTKAIRSAEVNANVSRISQIAGVRRLLVEKQKRMAADKGVVMDGRDIGTHVLPDAEVKVFLTASAGKRAERRYRELDDKGTMTLEEQQRELARRDRMDEQRNISPLIQAPDAVLLDSTEMPISEVVEAVLGLCRDKVTGGQ